jgi:hypothetical protein
MDLGPDPMLATIVACILLAFLLGAAARALKLPTILGYIVAGILIGPYTPGFVAEHGLVSAMAELGVALLLFSVGLHFRPADLLAVRRIAARGPWGWPSARRWPSAWRWRSPPRPSRHARWRSAGGSAARPGGSRSAGW